MYHFSVFNICLDYFQTLVQYIINMSKYVNWLNCWFITKNNVQPNISYACVVLKYNKSRHNVPWVEGCLEKSDRPGLKFTSLILIYFICNNHPRAILCSININVQSINSYDLILCKISNLYFIRMNATYRF